MHSSTARITRPYEWFVPAAIVGLAIAFIVRTIWLMDRGFDFTDESFYLASARQPTAYDITYGLFGYGLHPLFEIVNGSIAGFRRAAAFILGILGIIAALIAIGNAKAERWGPTSLQLIAVSAALPFAHYVLWLTTPSYNWFALARGLVMVGAMLDLYDPHHALRSAAIAAFAALLLVFTRPQNVIAYLAIYLLAVVTVVPTFRGKLLQMVRTGGLTIILIGAVAAVSPLRTIIHQLHAYIEIFGTSNPTDANLASKLLEFFRQEGGWIALACVPLLGGLITLHYKPASGTLRNLLVISGALIVSIVTLVQFWTSNFVDGIGPTAAVFAYVCLALASVRREADPRLLVLLGLATLIPLAATFGTSNRIIAQLPFFACLWGFIGLVAMSGGSGQGRFGATLAALICLTVTFHGIQSGLSAPYRLPTPVNKQVIPTPLGWGSELNLDAITRDFIMTLRNRAGQEGFCQGDAVIDLSGRLPGAVYAMGGQMPVFPWIFAGYPFSDHFAREVLKRVDGSVLTQSWLITSDTPGSFSVPELQSYGIDFTAYRLVVDLKHPLFGTSVKLLAPRAIQHQC
ncbi:putative membrane protein (GlpM family) [Bradyrhizobium barranii subsp. barranii]